MLKFAMLTLSAAVIFTSCATPLKTEEIRQKIEPGLSAADTLMRLGTPDSHETPAEGRRLFRYFDTGVYFVNDKLVQVFNTGETTVAALEKDPEAQARWAAVPDHRNEVVFSEASKKGEGPVNAYRAFFYLNDEASFRQVIRHQVDPEGYSTDLNALCLAIRGGFTEAVRELLEINVNTDALLRDHRKGKSYVKVRECTALQEDPAKVAKIKELFKAFDEKQALAAKNPPAPGEEKKPEKSLINWQAVQDWLKPQVPSAPDQKSKE